MAKKQLTKKVKTKVQPLMVREGAQYTCFGDGLCCTDIHGIGPLTEDELVSIGRIDPDAAGYDDDHEDIMMKTAADGGCVFLMEDQRCSIHAELGPEAKPEGCRRFPLGLVATPLGGRITTDHRCPCRTMGTRPDINIEETIPSISDSRGHLESDRKIGDVPVAKKESMPFAQWVELEAPLIAKLRGGENLLQTLGAKPFPELKGSSWKEQALEFLEGRDGAQFGVAMAWMADTILHMVDNERLRPPKGRPWKDAFDRAEARSGERTAAEVFGDWLADEIWSLKWAEDYHLGVARAELATRLVIAENLAARFKAEGARPDRAAAEAVMIVEIVGESEFWEDVKDRMRNV